MVEVTEICSCPSLKTDQRVPVTVDTVIHNELNFFVDVLGSELSDTKHYPRMFFLLVGDKYFKSQWH